jgi:hypothetical protein
MLIKIDKIINDSFPTQIEPSNNNADSDVRLLNNNDIEDVNTIEEQDTILKTHPFTSLLNLNIRQDDKGVTIIEKGPVAGRSFIKDTALVNQMLDYLFSQKYPIFPHDINFRWTAKPEERNELLSLSSFTRLFMKTYFIK